jgi:cation transport protein ChaC
MQGMKSRGGTDVGLRLWLPDVRWLGKKRGCLRRCGAELRGYKRAFNKASVRNWGSAKFPCPTLNLVASASARCCGIAFEFPDKRKQKVMLYLSQREGRDFVFPSLPIRLDDGVTVRAVISIYQGQNLIRVNGSVHIAKMAIDASGRDGACTSYIEGVADQLRLLRIDEPLTLDATHRHAVSECHARSIQRRLRGRW